MYSLRRFCPSLTRGVRSKIRTPSTLLVGVSTGVRLEVLDTYTIQSTAPLNSNGQSTVPLMRPNKSTQVVLVFQEFSLSPSGSPPPVLLQYILPEQYGNGRNFYLLLPMSGSYVHRRYIPFSVSLSTRISEVFTYIGTCMGSKIGCSGYSRRLSVLTLD